MANMSTCVLTRGKNISLQLKMHAIKIFNNNALSEMLAKDEEKATDELIACIKKEYLKLFNCDFEVSDASMAIEIWAHVYAEKFAEAVQSHSSLEFVDKMAQKIINHAEVINIGEKGHDYNRFIWDNLVPLKSVITDFLFPGQRE